MEYPKTDVGEHQPQLIWRDFLMRNVRIQHDKMLWLKDMIDIIDAHRFEDDFCHGIDTSYDWNLNEYPGDSGVDTPSCTDNVNGVLKLTTEGDDGDYGELTQMCECWKLVNCYPLYAEIRFYLDEITDSGFWFGLTTGESYFSAPNDAVLFHKDDGDAYLDFRTSLDGTDTPTTEILTLIADTWYRLGMHWDGDGTVRYFVIQDGDFPQTIIATGLHATNIPTTELQLGFGVLAGKAAAISLYVDYLKCVQKRVIEAVT